MIELEALKSVDVQTRNGAYESLKAEVYRICYRRLHTYFPEEIDGVVLRSLERIYKQIPTLKSNEELAKHTYTIAYSNAISCYWNLMAQKRGFGKCESLEALQQQEGHSFDPPDKTPTYSNLDLSELHGLFDNLEAKLTLEERQAFHDYYRDQLSHKEIAQKRGWPVGSVGPYIYRALKKFRNERLRKSQLMEALSQYLRMFLV